ncbi:unnamed protein product [Umbelopsis vinacea]
MSTLPYTLVFALLVLEMLIFGILVVMYKFLSKAIFAPGKTSLIDILSNCSSRFHFPGTGVSDWVHSISIPRADGRILERTYKLVLENISREEEVIALKTQNSNSLKVHDKRMSEVTEAHKQELVKVKKEIERKEMDLETLKKQCKQQSEEYFRLADRNNELERKGLPVENRKDK